MTITLTEAQHRLNTLIETQGDVVRGGYGVNCRYFNDDGTPSCIVGEAFAAELTKAGVRPSEGANQDSVQGLVNHGLLDMEPLALDYLTYAQEAQDTGDNWATAVDIAEQAISSVITERIEFAVAAEQLALF